MEIDQIIKIMSESPAIKLVQSRNFKHILPFLADVFSAQTAISSESLYMLLEKYLDSINDDLNETNELGVLIRTNEDIAKRWIKNWADDGYLANYQDESGSVIYELSYYTSKVLD